ncbi:MAG: hypothetical protein ABWW65_00740 [Thermoprotei archaeon]
MKSFLTIITTLAILFILSFHVFSRPVVYCLSIEKVYGDADTPKYYVITINKTYDATLYILDNTYNVVLVPLSVALPLSCSVQNRIPPEGPHIHLITGFANVNWTLPNGTRITELFYTIADYVGCGKDKAEVKEITLKYGGREFATAVIHVFVPIPEPEKYLVPLELYPGSIMFIYKYVNSSHFELDVKLYNTGYTSYVKQCITEYECVIEIAGFSIALRKYNITFRFLIDTNSWTAKYWNGHKWIPIGSLPLAIPAMDLSLLLYELYQSYSRSINYYLTHKTELQIVVDKVKSLIESGETEKAWELLHKLAEGPIPQIWKAYNASYLGKEIKIEGPGGSVVGPSIKITFPAYDKIVIKINKTGNLSNLIIEGLEKYIMEERMDTLNSVIAENNGFIYYATKYKNITRGTLLWTYIAVFPPGFGIDTLLILPAKHLSEYLGFSDRIEYAFLEIFPRGLPISSEDIVIEESSSLPGPRYGNFTIVIDSRLAEKWMLTNKKAVNPDTRVSILMNLMSTIMTKYGNTWYKVINKGNPEKEFQDFLSYLESAVLATAYQLGGEKGRDLVENLIHGGSLFPETANTTATTQFSPPSTTTQTSSPGSSEISSGEVNGFKWHTVYIVVPVLVVIVVASLVILRAYRRK